MSSVGGDGFWMYKKDDVIYLAVFDCMGHGHLASMMTRVYTNALNKLVIDHRIEFPGSILQFIHREIMGRFKNKDIVQVDTGADLGIVKINTAQRRMQFAGARMDLYGIRCGEMDVIKGDRLQIGEMFDFKHEYHSREIELTDDPTSFYLSSDGLKDMIGGPDGKKFGSSKMKDLLVEESKRPMIGQKESINDQIDRWLGSNSQNDDILLVGFKF